MKNRQQAEFFMRQAIRLSVENARTGKGGPFAAMVVKDGVVIATGVNEVTANNDPTAHAEIVAIRKACQVLGSFQLTGCELYTTCEPCPMCLGAIYWARPDKLYYANTKEDAAAIHFDDAFIYKEIELPPASRHLPEEQLLHQEALAAFEAWKNNPNKIEY